MSISKGPWRWGWVSYAGGEPHEMEGDVLLDAEGHTVGVQQRDYDMQKQHKIPTFAPNMRALSKVPEMVELLRDRGANHLCSRRVGGDPLDKRCGECIACRITAILAYIDGE